MGYGNSVQYLQGARNLMSQGSGAQTFVRTNGDTLFYKITTNEFSVLTADNTIRTYFKPDTGILYWFEQTGGM
jgi:pyocin large subunit-like protein